MRITWTILDTEYALLPDGKDADIRTVFWQCTCLHQPSGVSQLVTGCSALPPADPITRVPFQKLSKKQLLDWCFSLNIDRAGIEAQLSASVQAQIAPAVQRGLPPWKGSDANDITS